MDIGEKNKIFTQFYLYNNPKGLRNTKTSNFSKVQAYTKGCLLKQKMNLYKGAKYFFKDLQMIMDFDAQSASFVFAEYKNIIRFIHRVEDEETKVNMPNDQVLVQCRRCGKYTIPWKYCPKCEDTHYCSESCEVNIKLTHEKQQCKVRMYPKIQHATLIEVHFGSRLGQNIEIYFQHETRSSALMRGKTILSNMYDNFSGIKNTSGKFEPDLLRSTKKMNAFEEKLRGYNVNLNPNQKQLEFVLKNEKEYPTGVLKVDIESLEDIHNLYEQNPLLEQIQLYLAAEGAVFLQEVEQIHNNHIQYIYLFRMP